MICGEPVAAVVRGDYGGGVIYLGREPELVISGTVGDTGQLEHALAERSRERAGWDQPHPPGAAIGAFDFEGNWHFSFFRELEVKPTADLWPEGGPVVQGPSDEEGWECVTGREEYAAMVRSAQDEIRAGKIYQVNLARFLHREVRGLQPWELFRWLWRAGQAPRSFFYQLGNKSLAGASMELFLGIEGKRIVTQPIKGTRGREANREGDERAALELGTNPKEVAELIMITDLLRNDLGAVCEYGSVQARDLVRRRSYSHVHHLYSTVEGKLRAGIGPVQAVRESLPGGSVTGAPKRSAGEILRRLEAEPRGHYTGAVGYFGYDGTARFSMGIRMAEMEGDQVRCGVGSGITAASDPEGEYDETKIKARVLTEAMAAYLATRTVRV